MKNVITEAGATNVSLAPQTEAAKINGLRNLILDLLFASPVITAQEWATAVERTSNTQSAATLAKWYQNTAAEIGRREAAAQVVVPALATTAQKQQIVRLLNNPTITRRHKNRVLVGIDRLTGAEAAAEVVRLLAYISAPFGGGAPAAAVSYVQAA